MTCDIDKVVLSLQYVTSVEMNICRLIQSDDTGVLLGREDVWSDNYVNYQMRKRNLYCVFVYMNMYIM
jgi:hypothetical protein